MIGVTGDAMARPLADALEQMQGDVDLSSLFSFSSTAAIFSQTVKEQLGELLPDGLVMSDAIGSTESGMNGIRIVQKGDAPKEGITTVHGLGRHRRARRRPRTRSSPAPASSAGSRAAATSRSATTTIPEKTAATFVTDTQGRRWSIPGDYALLEADGRITLLGRGSVSINSGGEKIYPEEVEGALKSHPDVFDVLVVGVPDERWGERVAALLQTARRQARRRSRSCRRTAAAGSRATRCRASCSSSPKCRACPTASPTTGAPRTKRARSPPPTDRRAGREPDDPRRQRVERRAPLAARRVAYARCRVGRVVVRPIGRTLQASGQ